jgi:hypothetical protein
MTSRAVSVWPYEEARGNQLATQLEAALSRKGALEHKLKLAAEAAAAAAAKHAEAAKGRGLHSFTLELNLSNSRHIHELSWVIQWTEELKLSRNGDECKPLANGTFDANIAVERAKSLSAKLKESDRRLKDSEMEVTTSRVRQDDMRRRESTAGEAWRKMLATSSNAFSTPIYGVK